MYRYRRSTPAERRELIRERVERRFPIHAPPHTHGPDRCFMITAACYEHRPIMQTDERRHHFLAELTDACDATHTGLEAWVVLPNHYHLLIDSPDLRLFSRLIQQVHGRTSRQWNVEDNAAGRKCWYRFSDRAIRSEAHYFAALNYIHANPVKHGLVSSGLEWSVSSIHQFEDDLGIELLRDLWTKYPVGTMGSGWDD